MTGKASQELIKLTISCACNRITGSCDVPCQSIPLAMVLCHCNTCRHSSGVLSVSHVSVPSGSSHLQINGQPCCYRTPFQTRYFCGDCGCSIYQKMKKSGTVELCTGALETAGFVEMNEHIFVADTIDGGLSEWIRAPNTNETQHERNHLGGAISSKISESLQGSSRMIDHLRGYCHCRGVQFTISRPDEIPSISNVPWPDLIMPYHSKSSENTDDEKWWLRANGTKYLAGTCACNSCRLGSGYDIQTWAFIPKANINLLDGEGLNYAMGTLRQYESSDGIYREFCKICGATVFWHSGNRPDIVDVSVGLLDSARGARAEDWLEWWTDRVSFEELAQNTKYIALLSRGLREWAENKNMARVH